MSARNCPKTSRIRHIRKKWDARRADAGGFSRIFLEISANALDPRSSASYF